MSPQGKLSLKHPAILPEDLRRICDRQSAQILVAFAHGRMAINSANAPSMVTCAPLRRRGATFGRGCQKVPSAARVACACQMTQRKQHLVIERFHFWNGYSSITIVKYTLFCCG